MGLLYALHLKGLKLGRSMCRALGRSISRALGDAASAGP